MKVGKNPNSSKIDKVLSQARQFTKDKLLSLNLKMEKLTQNFKISSTRPSWRQIFKSTTQTQYKNIMSSRLDGKFKSINWKFINWNRCNSSQTLRADYRIFRKAHKGNCRLKNILKEQNCFGWSIWQTRIWVLRSKKKDF